MPPPPGGCCALRALSSPRRGDEQHHPVGAQVIASGLCIARPFEHRVGRLHGARGLGHHDRRLGRDRTGPVAQLAGVDDPIGDEHGDEEDQQATDERCREGVLRPPSVHGAIEDVECRERERDDRDRRCACPLWPGPAHRSSGLKIEDRVGQPRRLLVP
jgi:hypothetical protein